MTELPPRAGDPMEDPAVGMVLMALILAALIFVAGLGVAYWGDEIAKPSWNERSVPSPRLY